jgi:mRNA-degrading endonuclease HigB of HigAB toxin-antitoxin module
MGDGMVDNFSTIKSQLKELAPIINEFKYEQVQLRLIEIIFNKEFTENKAEIKTAYNNKIRETTKTRRKEQRKNSQPSLKKIDKKSPSRKGPVHYLSQLIDEGYFDQPRQINAIVKHLKDDKAKNYKSNDLSTGLRRLLNAKKIKRNKISEKQYEYEKAD